MCEAHASGSADGFIFARVGVRKMPWIESIRLSGDTENLGHNVGTVKLDVGTLGATR